MSALIDGLKAIGFVEAHTGGGCMAMFRFDGVHSDVATSTDGCSLPEQEDWLYCRYRGNWSEDADVPEIEGHDSDGTLVDLITLVTA